MSNKLEAILTMDKKGFTSAIKSAQGDVKGLEKSGSSMGKAMKVAGAVAVVGIAGLAAGLYSCAKEAIESEKVHAETAAILKTTGGAAKITAGEIEKLSGKIRDKTGYDDEAVQSGANMLLTFTNVRNEVGEGNDVFNQAVDLSTDMARKFGTDVPAASKLLGKALQDPIKGVTALRKMGVMLTDQQMDSIKGFVAQGDMLSAQKLILAEVNTEIGLVAEAYGSTYAGKLDILKSKFGDMKEAIGNALLPALIDLTDALSKINWEAAGNAVARFIDSLKQAPTMFRGIGEQIKGFFNRLVESVVIMMKSLGDVLEHIPGPIGKWGTELKQSAGTALTEVREQLKLTQLQHAVTMGKMGEANALVDLSWQKMGTDTTTEMSNMMNRLQGSVRQGTATNTRMFAEGMGGMLNALVSGMPGIEGKQKELVAALTRTIQTGKFYDAQAEQVQQMAAAISNETGVPVESVMALLNTLKGTITADDPSGAFAAFVANGAYGITEGGISCINAISRVMNQMLGTVQSIGGTISNAIGGVLSHMGFHGGGLVFHGGGLVLHGGGEIPSYHFGGADGQEVIAKLLRGEYVMQNAAVDKYGVDFMNAINSGLLPSSSTNNTSNDIYNVSMSLPNVRTANDAQEIMRVIDGMANSGAHLRRVLP